ncbi:hypothetical protein [Sporomusa termitida]|uniref:Uncharacterized protein n=1 Tax=Sporomusa termitida TaxID=2377 RepID=A0A517DX98_9FIRM|nr:hypothetical protein [Sporomusa termitida]QDR81984.1 hypothetical protein SPTER_34050 [Sporomusa termitida]
MTELERIEFLKEQLLKLGYRNYQLQDIYREVLGQSSCQPAALSSEQCRELIETMEEYCSFAQKCLKNKINN